MAKKGNDFLDFLKVAVAVAVVGGLIAMFLGPILAGVATQLLGQAFLTIVIALLIIYIAKKTRLDDQNFVEWIVLLFFIGAVGSLVAAYIPSAGAFILSVGSFTISGLAFTILYVLIAEWILGKIGMKL